MGTMYFDIWAPDDLAGVALAELTEVTGKHIIVVDNAPGSGEFQINRNSAEYAMCVPDSFIRVRIEAGGPFDWDDTRYITGFFLEEGWDTIVSVDEEGGEVVELRGRTTEAYLERAVLDWEAHYADDIVWHPYDKTALTDGQWHFSDGIPHSSGNVGSPGGTLAVVMRNAINGMAPSPIPLIVDNFSINNDSNGDAWEDTSGQFDLDVGTDYLSILSILVEGGVWYKLTPSFDLYVWDRSQGQDLSGSVIFEKGVNIRESGQRAIHASQAKSRVLVKGSTKKGALKYRWADDTTSGASYEDLTGGSIEGELGVRLGFLDYPNSPTNNRLAKAGRKYLADRKNWHDGPPTIGVIETEGQSAFVDYFPGDTVGVNLPGIPLTAVIHAIDLEDDEVGQYQPRLEFVGETWQGQSTMSDTATPTSSPVGGSEYGIDAAPSSGEIPVAEGETLLIWVYPAGTALDVNGGSPSGIAAGNLFYVNGPGVFTISSPDANSQFHYIVVGGSGNYHAGG